MTRLSPSVATVLVCGLAGIGAGLLLGAGQGMWLLVGLVSLVFAYATWTRPEFAVGALLLVLPLIGDRTLVSVPALPDITVGRLLIAWSIIVIARAISQHQRRARILSGIRLGQDPDRSSLFFWVFLFMAFMALAAVRNPSMQAGIQGWLDSYLLPFALLIVITRYRWSPREIDVVVGAYLVGCCLWSVLALAESRLGYSFFTSSGTLPWAPRGSSLARTGGPFINPAFLGTAVGVGLMLAWVYARRQGPLQRIAIASVPIAMIGLAVTQTRASWLGAVVGAAAVLALTERRRLKVVALAALGLSVGVVAMVSLLGVTQLENRATSTNEIFNRVIVQRAAVNIVADHPLLGVGSGRFATSSRSDLRSVGTISGSFGIGTLVPHNTVLSTTVDGGVGAGAILIVVFGLLVAGALRLLARPMRHHLGVAALGCIVVFVVNAMFIDIFLGTTLVVLSLTVIGVVLSPQAEPSTRR